MNINKKYSSFAQIKKQEVTNFIEQDLIDTYNKLTEVRKKYIISKKDSYKNEFQQLLKQAEQIGEALGFKKHTIEHLPVFEDSINGRFYSVTGKLSEVEIFIIQNFNGKKNAKINTHTPRTHEFKGGKHQEVNRL